SSVERTAKSFRPRSIPTVRLVVGSGRGSATSVCRTTNRSCSARLTWEWSAAWGDLPGDPGMVVNAGHGRIDRVAPPRGPRPAPRRDAGRPAVDRTGAGPAAGRARRTAGTPGSAGLVEL